MASVQHWQKLVAVTALLAGFAVPQTLERERNFLVKLRTPVGSKISRPGSAVSASVISPETFLGGLMEGTVEAATPSGNGTIRITFRSLQYKGRTIGISSVTTSFVNSKGHKLVDDEERPIRVEEGGTLVSQGQPLWIDEGAELNLRVKPVN